MILSFSHTYIREKSVDKSVKSSENVFNSNSKEIKKATKNFLVENSILAYQEYIIPDRELKFPVSPTFVYIKVPKFRFLRPRGGKKLYAALRRK